MTTTSEILDALQFSFLRNREIMASATGAEGSWSDLRGTNGDDKIIYFKFADNGLPDDFAMTGALSGWEVLSIADKGAIRAVLEEIETYLDIDFVETTGTPDLDIGMVDLQATGAPANVVGRGGVAITYGSEGVVGYKGGVVFDNNFDVADPDNVGTIFHEIAHGLGLKHPFDTPALPPAEENNKYSVMSYTPNPETGRDATNLMLYDVVALQDIWGAATHNDTDTVYDLSSHDELKVIWDTGGIDRLDMQGQSGPVTVNLTEGVFSSLAGVHDLVIGFGTQIEEARGSVGRDRLTGNAADNWLDGGSNGDTLMGGDGADTLLGRGGRDQLWG